jgi:hydantoinase/carbamoylase family amidase
MESLIEKFARIGKDATGGVTRLAFSPEDRSAREEFLRILATEFALHVRSDSLGNIFARREGKRPDLAVIMTGSHLDSVRNGGKFDGPAGVFSSLEAFRALDLLNIETEHPFELCILSSEEPNTFGISTFGSRGMVGVLQKESLRSLRDEQGQTFRSALAGIGGDLERIEDAVRQPNEIEYFVELHIEQMPYLEQKRKDIGIVEGVTGIYREAVTVNGTASHCGTTPMDARQDALCAAAEILLALESAAVAEGRDAVATVGHVNVFPNSINIVPQRVMLDAEIRSYHPECIERIKHKMQNAIAECEKSRGLHVERQVTYDSPPTHFSPTVIRSIRKAAGLLGLRSMEQVSMAGHDAAHVSRIADSGMIFIPCKKGRSHCPEEQTAIENIVKGSQCLLMTLLLLDKIRRRRLEIVD